MDIRFIYHAPGKEQKEVTLLGNWKESGRYLCGVDACSNSFKTFRKDRVVSYLDGSESLLESPFTLPPPSVSKEAEHFSEILFTGFPSVKRTYLEGLVASLGMKVCKTVTKNLTYLCVGPNAGPTKVEAARNQHVFIVSQPQLLALLETGELPDEIELL